MDLLVLVGRPGVGKLAVARELAALTTYPVFHNHLTVDLVGALFPFGTPAFTALRETIWLAAVAEAIRAGLPGLVFTFAPERTVAASFPTALANVVAGGGGRLIAIELRCAPDEHRRRLVDPSRAGTGKLASLAAYDALAAAGAFDAPTFAPALVLDTTALAPRATATRIVAEVAAVPRIAPPADLAWRATDHVQLAMPIGGEPVARAFFVDRLGLREVPKPAALAARGGCWFEAGERGEVKIHLGAEADFRPARKAHPAWRVRDLRGLVARAGLDVRWSDEIPGTVRCHVDDPFGNRLELIDADP